MFESFIITLREGIEASLVIGILLGILKKISREDLVRFVYGGVGAAVVASGLGALFLQSFVINEEVYEGTLYLVAAFFVITMLCWMRRHARTLKGEIETAVHHMTGGAQKKGEAWGIFAFTFFMVFREGVETVLFLSAVGLTTQKLLSFIAGLLGLVLAVLFCVAFVKGTLRIDLGRFFRVSTAVLWIFVFQLWVNGFHELSEAQILPASQREMALVGPLVRNNAFFILAILAIPIFIFLFSARKRENLPDEMSGPERRLALSKAKSERRWRFSWSAVSFLILLSLGAHTVYSNRSEKIDPPLLVESQGGSIKIPLSEVNDGRLHRFGLNVGEGMVRFLVIKTSDDRYRTAFDLCEICGDYGYRQEGENIICLNCTAAIHPPTMGVAGGCNPIPLQSWVEGGELLVKETDLKVFQDHFKMKVLPEVTCTLCHMKLHFEEAKEIKAKGKTFYLCPMESCQKEFEKRYLNY